MHRDEDELAVVLAHLAFVEVHAGEVPRHAGWADAAVRERQHNVAAGQEVKFVGPVRGAEHGHPDADDDPRVGFLERIEHAAFVTAERVVAGAAERVGIRRSLIFRLLGVFGLVHRVERLFQIKIFLVRGFSSFFGFFFLGGEERVDRRLRRIIHRVVAQRFFG